VTEKLWQSVGRLRERLGPLWWYTVLMFLFSRVGDLVNLLIAIILVPIHISNAQMGAILPIMKLVALVAAPLSILLATALKYVSVFANRDEPGMLRAMLRDLVGLLVVLSLLIIAGLFLTHPFLAGQLKIDDPKVFPLIVAMCVLGCWVPGVTMACQGMKHFRTLILVSFSSPFFRLAAILVFLPTMKLAGYLMATLAASISGFLILTARLLYALREPVKCVSYRQHWPEMRRYTLQIGAMIGLTLLQAAVEPWVVRQRMSIDDSAAFYMAAMLGSIPRYLAGALTPFFFILVSDLHETGESTRKVHLQALGATAGIGLLFSGVFLFSGAWILEQYPPWSFFVPYTSIIALMSLITAIDVLLSFHFLHENACHRFAYLKVFVPVVLLELAVLYGLNGWSALQPHLPTAIWGFVETNVRDSLGATLLIMLAARIVILPVILRGLIRWRQPAKLRAGEADG
jgi:hypothetical protein